MKKSLFAIAAVTAFAGAAQAQSSVTVYGLMDASYSSLDTKTTTAGATTSTKTSGFGGTAGPSAASRIGFRGREDIGGGNAVTFNLEYAITPGTGTTVVESIRTSTLGFTNKAFGSITAGRQLTGIHTIVAGTVFAANNMTGDLMYSSQAGGAGYNTNLRIHNAAVRSSNSVKYTTPNFSGFTAVVDYSGDRSTVSDNPNQVNVGNMGITAAYANGPFTVRAGTHTVKSMTAATAESSTTINAASIRYSAKGLTAEALYGANKTESLGAQASKVNATQLNVQYAFGKVTPFIKYGVGSSQTGVSGQANADTTGMQVGAQYSLSKRSTLYAAYGKEDIKVKQATTAIVNNKVSAQQIALGLRHTF